MSQQSHMYTKLEDEYIHRQYGHFFLRTIAAYLTFVYFTM